MSTTLNRSRHTIAWAIGAALLLATCGPTGISQLTVSDAAAKAGSYGRAALPKRTCRVRPSSTAAKRCRARGRLRARAAAVVTGDALYGRTRARLGAFKNWLAPTRAKGYIGEVGWPGNPAASGDSRWNALARDWYGQARAAGLWVTAWSAGDYWQPSYKLLVYGTGQWPTLSPNPQASVVESQTAYPELNGINVAGAEFGYTPVDQPTSTFSNAAPGAFGVAYTYPQPSSLAYMAGRGIRLVRLPVRWERVQPVIGGALDQTELGRIRSVLTSAAQNGLRVIIDLHNYGAYYEFDGSRGVRRAIGSSALPASAFADFWAQMARGVGGYPALEGYGLMNEPTGMSGATAWEQASRAAVDAIRAAGDARRVFVGGYDWSSVTNFARSHPRGPWISDSGVMYEGHQYFDDTNTGNYALSYSAEVSRAKSQGYRPPA